MTESKRDSNILNFAIADYEAVCQEILGRRNSRSSILIATIGALVTVAVGIFASIQQSPPNQWRQWVSLAMVIPLFVLVAGLAVSFHNARAINDRMGYVGALAHYISKGRAPEHYSGWAAAVVTLHRCRGASAREKKIPCGCPEHCTTRARRSAIDHDLVLGTTTGLGSLASFAALSAVAYALLLLAIGSALLLAFWHGLSAPLYAPWPAAGSRSGIILIVLSVCLAPMAASALCQHICESKEKEQQQKEPERLLRRRALGRAALVTLSVSVVYVIAPGLIRLFELWSAWWQPLFYLGLVGISFIVPSIGVLIVLQLIGLENGEYSIQLYCHSWNARFKRCPLMENILAPALVPARGRGAS